MNPPRVVMISGPNGSGKTSTAKTLLPDFLHVNEFVNADEIASGISPFNSSSVAIEAGRLMLKRIDTLIEKRKSFAFETTSATHTHTRTLQNCRNTGYQTELVFLYLSSAELAVERVKLRVSQGGHSIPKSEIVRRYYKGIKMLFSQYVHLADIIEIYDNSPGRGNLVAEKHSIASNWSIQEPTIWQTLQNISNEK